MSLLKIKPLDNTFFRKGDPFNKNINNHLESMDTPYKSTFFGAIFTALLTENDQFRQEFFKNKIYDHKKILIIKNIFLYDDFDVYIKAPLDLFIDKDNIFNLKRSEFKELRLITNSVFKYNLESPEEDYIRADDYYISVYDFIREYKKNKILSIELKHKDEIFIKNTKVGIGLDKDSYTVAEGQLYSLAETEFKNNDWSYLVEYELKNESNYFKDNYESEISYLNSGYLKLGGESKVCKYNKIDEKDLDDLKEFNENQINQDTDLMRILLLQEVYFKKNIREIFNEKSPVKILGISNPKPIYIGGYDMQKKAAKTMYRGYPAGTIFLLEKNDSSNIKLFLNKQFGINNDLDISKYIII
ncbi:type III-B CRISPR module-associated Cmr3 family protein [Halanaerobium salsuginis]|jgi:CRISPR-associated protein Cmr3|uniref:CRISPR-associated protein Cmr3 n=1 Tax=Halanaerobium salsuginis TaxID=29563 RepID=A0A1I4M2J6_9FIRM|nr:type III-B CRISPR module-associated Cmr3 family protein [Halanaerobium salsuginis]SFL97420.1 CRISPR-associated protein Cmr3 [Halanaerobium salsuginis]